MEPDEHTHIAVFRACSKIGDVQTAYDALQDMKLKGLPLTEHAYNGLIKTYAGAAAQWNVKEEHIDQYLNDALKLFEQSRESGIKPNVIMLNSLVHLHCNALRVDELDANVLPLYEKHRIKHDVYTYQFLSKMYLNMREFDTVKNLYKTLKREGLTPNKMLLNGVLEASIRTGDTDLVYDSLKDFVAIKHEPHKRLVGKLANMKDLPDRLYMVLR